MKWYEKAIPKIKDIQSNLKEASKNISQFNQVKGVYAWGCVAKKINNPEERIKDIDILIDCSFDSGDLLAIDNTNGILKMSAEELEDLGFNPDAVSFTKTVLKYKAPSFDFWAASKDKKLLHWGPITETIEEWRQVRKEAENKAEIITGINNNKVLHASENDRKKWHQAYEKYLHEFGSGCPQGWYSSQNNVDKIFEKAIKINE